MASNQKHPEQPQQQAASASNSQLANLDKARLRVVMFARLSGDTSFGPPVDPRVGKQPFEWLSDEFRRGNAGLQSRMTAVLDDFLSELTDTRRWPERARYALLDLIQDVGEPLLDTIHGLVRRQTFLKADGLGPAVHAALLKCLIAIGHHATPEFWLSQFQVLGPAYGALTFSGLIDHGLSLAMSHLPQLSVDDEARDYIRWLIPELQDRFGTAAVVEQLDQVRQHLPTETYRLYKNDLVPAIATDVRAANSRIDAPKPSPTTKAPAAPVQSTEGSNGDPPAALAELVGCAKRRRRELPSPFRGLFADSATVSESVEAA